MNICNKYSYSKAIYLELGIVWNVSIAVFIDQHTNTQLVKQTTTTDSHTL